MRVLQLHVCATVGGIEIYTRTVVAPRRSGSAAMSP